MTITSGTHAALRERCVASLHRLSQTFGASDEEWLTLDLTMGQLKAMMTLVMSGPLGIGDLGRRIGISEPAASLLVGQLESNGLVSREPDPADRRRALVTPAAAARERFEGLLHGRIERVFGLLERLADDDLEALARGLGALENATQVEATVEGRRV